MEPLPSLWRSAPSTGEGGFGAHEGRAKAPLRILVYSIHYAPEVHGPGRYTGELCAWLAHRGHQVRAITAPPHYPDWRVQAGYAAYAYRREQLDGVHVYRCPLWVPRQPSAMRRLAHRLSFAVSSLPAMAVQCAWRPHVVMAMGLLAAPVAWPLARVTAARTWLHRQEGGDATNASSTKRSGLAAAAEHVMLRGFDRVSANSESALAHFSNRGVSAGRCVLFPDWVDCTQIHPLTGPSRLRSEWRIPPSACVVLYCGNMARKSPLESIIEAARRLTREPRLVFLLCGTGPARAPVQAATRGLHNVRWLPAQGPERLNALLNVADVHLLPQRGVAGGALPPELPAMLASGRPILATGAAETALTRIAHACGAITAPGTAELVNALRQLLEHDIARRHLGAAARRYAEQHFHKERVLAQFEEQLSTCVVERSERRVPPEVRSA